MKFAIRELLRSTTFGLIIFIVLFLINIAAGNKISIDYHLLIQFLYIMIYTYALHFVNAGIYVLMDRWFEGSRTSPKRIVLGFVMAFMASMVVLLLLRIFEDVVIEGKTFAQYFQDERLDNFYTPTIILLIITFSVHLFYFYRQYQENRVKQQKIIAGTASAKFETLKNQIDPHFLFNSLNVLSSLIEENPDSAQKFTTSLSKVYRYVLEQKDKELVSIEEELAFAKTYMNLLKMRFENSLFYELPEKLVNPEGMVVPLSLQLLLENTVKHNVVSEQKPLHIRIFEQEGYLVVQNDYQKKEVLQDRRGVGLQNIISRYAIITRREVVIEQTEKHFTVKLPTLTKQVTIMETVYTTDQDNYNKALKHVEDIKGFYGHLFSYVVVIGGLFVLNLLTSPGTLWFFWPAMGWGLGLAAHALRVFNIMPFMGKEWEQRKIRELMEEERNSKWR